MAKRRPRGDGSGTSKGVDSKTDEPREEKKKVGRGRAALRRGLRTPNDVRRFLEEVAAAVLTGEVTTEQARWLGRLASQALRAQELARRLARDLWEQGPRQVLGASEGDSGEEPTTFEARLRAAKRAEAAQSPPANEPPGKR